MSTNINISFNQVALLTIVSLFTASLTHAADLLDFRALHAQYVNQYADHMENQSLSGHPEMGYYYMSYYLHGMLSAVEKTQDEAMLQKVIHYIDNMLSKTTVKAGHKVWGPFESSSGRPIQLYFYKACTPIARAAAVIMRNPTFRKKYGSAATRYINFLDDSFIQYFYVETFGKKIPFLDKDLGGINTTVSWSDKLSLFGETATSLYVATQNAPTDTDTDVFGHSDTASLRDSKDVCNLKAPVGSGMWVSLRSLVITQKHRTLHMRILRRDS